MRIKNVTRVLALVGLISLTFAASTTKMVGVKQRLAERQNQLETESREPSVLAQTTQDKPIGEAPVVKPADKPAERPSGDCGCGCDLDLEFRPTLTPHCGECHTGPLPCQNLGEGCVNENDCHLEHHEKVHLHNKPDEKHTKTEESTCVSDECATHEELEKGCKLRTFKINGEITVSEDVTFQERSIAEDRAEGRAEKSSNNVECHNCGACNKHCYTVDADSPLQYSDCGCGDRAVPAAPAGP